MISVQTMRALDYWLGLPLCIVAAVVRSLFRAFFPGGRVLGTPQKVLFIELSEAGSAVLATPAVERAQELFPDAEFWWLIFQRHAPGLELLGRIPRDHILTIRATTAGRFVRDVLSVVRRIRKLGVDTVIDLELFSRFTSLLTLAAGAPRRVGFHRGDNEGLYRGNFLTHRVFFNPHIHVSLNFCALVEALTCEEPGWTPTVKKRLVPEALEVPSLPPTRESLERGAALVRRVFPDFDPELHRLVLLNPDPGVLRLRAWPAECYGELAARILQFDPGAVIGVLGLPEAELRVRAISASAHSERCISLVGCTEGLADLLALFHNAALIVSNDSGPAHFAGIAGIPTVVLFGPETPELYRPFGPRVVCLFAGLCCSPCYSAWNHRSSPCVDNLCLRAISVDRVWEECRRILGGAPASTKGARQPG